MDRVGLLETTGRSHTVVRESFARPEAAARYPAAYGNSRRDRRERKAILRAMACVPRGAWVLDLPCGAGRGTRLLLEKGYRVTAADSSEPMLALARASYRSLLARLWVPAAEFTLCDVMATGFPANHFDAVFCNRLLHHFREPHARRAALAELGRISRGPVIASFFNTFALDWLGTWLSRAVRGPGPAGRLSRGAVSMRTFAADVEAAGLRIEKAIPARWGVSRQWYTVLRKA